MGGADRSTCVNTQTAALHGVYAVPLFFAIPLVSDGGSSVNKGAREYRNRLDSQYLSGTLVRMASRDYALSSAAQTENPSADQTDGFGKQKYASILLSK